MATDLCLLLTIRKGNVAKTIGGYLGGLEKARMNVVCQRRSGVTSTQLLTVLTVRGAQRLLGGGQRRGGGGGGGREGGGVGGLGGRARVAEGVRARLWEALYVGLEELRREEEERSGEGPKEEEDVGWERPVKRERLDGEGEGELREKEPRGRSHHSVRGSVEGLRGVYARGVGRLSQC